MKGINGKHIAIGMIVGVAIGLAMHNLAMGIAIGIVFSIGWGSFGNKKKD